MEHLEVAEVRLQASGHVQARPHGCRPERQQAGAGWYRHRVALHTCYQHVCSLKWLTQ